MSYKVGDIMKFTYPNYACGGIEHEGLKEYAEHSGQLVTIIREERDAFDDGDGNKCRGYRVKAADGWEGLLWPGELTDPIDVKR